MANWLLKTEPEEYSWNDLERDVRATWDGVKAPAALKNIARMKPEDKVFFYHTGKERKVVGIAKVVSEPYPDPEEADEKLLVVDIEAVKPLKNSVTLKAIKETELFPEWELVRLPRLSVVPVSKEQWNKVLSWSEIME